MAETVGYVSFFFFTQIACKKRIKIPDSIIWCSPCEFLKRSFSARAMGSGDILVSAPSELWLGLLGGNFWFSFQPSNFRHIGSCSRLCTRRGAFDLAVPASHGLFDRRILFAIVGRTVAHIRLSLRINISLTIEETRKMV